MLKGLDVRSDRFLTDLNTITRNIAKAQRQITSGKRINSVSDAPDQVSDLLAARTELGSVQQTHKNLDLVKTEVDTAESTLGQAVSIMDRVLSLGTQGASTVADADSRKVLGGEVGSILEQLVYFAGSTVNGRYVFSGDGDQTAPYSIDLTQDNPVSSYLGTTSTRVIEQSQGLRFPVAKTAQEIFDNPDPAKNVFQTVNELRLALLNNDEPGVEAAVGKVRQAAQHLTSEQAFYGSVQNRVNDGLEIANKQELNLKSQISSIEDADVSAAILEMTNGGLQQQAALGAEAKRPRTSLFDYIG